MLNEDNNYCVYLYTNINNNKKYVGKTATARLDIRDKQHVYNSKTVDSVKSVPFSSALRKHGRENFKLEVVECDLNEETAFKLEGYYVDFYDTRVDSAGVGGYNSNAGGIGGVAPSEQCRKKHADSMKKVWRNEELNKKLISEERRLKISKGVSDYLLNNPEKHISKRIEIRNKKAKRMKMNNPMKNLELANKIKGVNNPMNNPEVREKHRKAVIESHNTPEYKSKMSKISTLSHASLETREKISKNSWMKTDAGKQRFSGANNPSARKVKCITTGETFETITSASEKLGVKRRSIINVCNGHRPHTRGLKFEYIDEK